MNVLISGMNGTVAPYVAHEFTLRGHHVLSYDRTLISTENSEVIEGYLLKYSVDMIIHLAMGSVEWSALLALLSKKLNIMFIYISTVSVYANHQIGPYDIHTIPEPNEDYGKYKRESEIEVINVNPRSKIIRLGWQIGEQDGKNQMLSFIYKHMREDGFITASSKWYPSASFLTDSAKAVYDISSLKDSGIYHVNSNDHMSFFDICTHLSHMFPNIKVKESTDFVADHRMVDSRVNIMKFSALFSQNK
ncbi:MAG: sugar nucleotide-binding protein [Acholeplasmataceae bacterium]|jgi:dTDP-4-dehydrorhamnose reductase|nr:sugar nucleotide-binding protein [Acholeplasmataceae bacterium]